MAVKANVGYNTPMLGARIALKEWAVIVDAIGKGEQLLLLRKGGIADPGEGFQLKSREFFLYPTLEHQKEDQLRPQFRDRVKKLAPDSGSTVNFQVYAGVALQKEVKDFSVLAGLEKYHLWSKEFFEQRKAYKPELPTQLLVVRAYVLRKPVAHPVKPEYAGCKSWVELGDPIPVENAEPVWDNRRFVDVLNEIDSVLSR